MRDAIGIVGLIVVFALLLWLQGYAYRRMRECVDKCAEEAAARQARAQGEGE